MSQLELIEEIASYADDPLGFAQVIFPWGEGELAGQQLRKWQAEELAELRDHLQGPNRFTPYLKAIVSGNGPGKSTLVAMLTKWGLSTCPDTRIIITANTGAQLSTKTQPEVAKWFRLAEDREFWDVQATRISVAEEEYRATYRADFETWSENQPEAFAGLHNKGKRIIVIFDEASGIARAIWDVVKGALTDEGTEIMFFALGNGMLNEGPFFECFNADKHRWRTRHIDTRDVEGTNKQEIAGWLEDEGEDSDWFRIHVRGLFPRHSELQFIGHDVVSRARKYHAEGFERLPRVLACDVARFGSAQTVIGYRQGRKYVELEKYRKMDTQFTAHRVVHWIKELEPEATVIDASGVGGGVVDTCIALGYQVTGFDGGGEAYDSMKYGNRRAEIWAKTKIWLEAGAQIPDDEELSSDLCGPHFYYKQGKSSHGALMIEPKEAMSRRGLSSPDHADTLCLTHAVEPAPREETQQRARFSPKSDWMR